MLGNTIFYIDAAKKEVCEAFVCGVSVNEEGFKVFSVKTPDNRYLVQLETLCFETKEAAEARIEEVVVINAEIKAIQEEANHKIDLLLDKIRGRPEYIHLTIKGEKAE